MGYYYNSQCTDQTCSQSCCNYYGSCPDTYSSSSYMNQCWYNYNYYSGTSCSPTSGSYSADTCCYSSSTGYYQCGTAGITGLAGAAIAGPIAGGIVGGVIFIIVIVCTIKKCRNQQQGQVGAEVGNTNTGGLDQSGRNTVTLYNTQGVPIYAKQPQIYQQQQQQYWGPADQQYSYTNQGMYPQQPLYPQQLQQFYQDPALYQPQNYQQQQQPVPPAYLNQAYPQQQIYAQNLPVY